MYNSLIVLQMKTLKQIIIGDFILRNPTTVNIPRHLDLSILYHIKIVDFHSNYSQNKVKINYLNRRQVFVRSTIDWY